MPEGMRLEGDALAAPGRNNSLHRRRLLTEGKDKLLSLCRALNRKFRLRSKKLTKNC